MSHRYNINNDGIGDGSGGGVGEGGSSGGNSSNNGSNVNQNRDGANHMRKLSFLGFGTDNNGDPNEVKLDAEMEKVFAGVGSRDKFDLAQFSDTPDGKSDPLKNKSRYNESDYDSHRTKSYSNRKPLLSSMKRQNSKDSPSRDVQNTNSSSTTTATNSPITSPAPIKHAPSDEPLVSERAAGYGEHHDSDSQEDNNKHVQFSRKNVGSQKTAEIIDIPENDSYDEDHQQPEEHRKRKGRHQHYKQRKHSLQDGSSGSGSGRRQSGDTSNNRKISVQPEDAALEEADIDELTSHRSDNPRGMRRHKIRNEQSSSRKDGSGGIGGGLPNISSTISPKKHFDHSPHEVFVQLDELQGTGEDREWKETARWIKYEEDVEEGSDRWGRPHVASLSFHSLLNLRRCLETGVVLMDLEERGFPGVAYRVVEQMVIEELIHENDKPIVMRALLLRHRHVNDHSHGGFHFGSRRKFSSYTSLQYLWLEDNLHGKKAATARHSICTAQQQQQQQQQYNNTQYQPNSLFVPSSEPFVLSRQFRRHSTQSHKINLSSSDNKSKILPSGEINGHNGNHAIDIKEETTYTSSQEDIRRALNDTILKRIPVGAEATTVLVGAVDFLLQPTIAFIRLAEGIPIPGITEVPIPVRFIFILLGPKQIDLDYHEVGRAIATLMSNEHFHKIAYKADDRRDLLSAINEFLDDSIVLPPGNWQREDLLPFDELKAKNEWIRDRKTKALQMKNKDKQAIADEEKQLLGGISEMDGGGKDIGGFGGGVGGGSGGGRFSGDGKKRLPVGPLEKTNRMWGGLINDVKRRYGMYKSDIMDGLNTETLAATVFLYFAILSTAITFGGLASDKTHNLIGISETLVSSSIVGMIFHASCGQPLVITGTTGPLLLFDEALYQFCLHNQLSFLTVRIYVGLWMLVIAILVSAFEGSVYVRLFTRFTQEVFSALITLIYLVETLMKLIKVYKRHPLLAEYVYAEPIKSSDASPIAEALRMDGNDSTIFEATTSSMTQIDEFSSISNANNVASIIIDNITLPSVEFINSTDDIIDVSTIEPITTTSLLATIDKYGLLNQPNTALFCTMLTLGTFALAYYLRIFRNSHFLGRSARRALGDFGVPISIAIFVALDFLIPEVYTDKLSVPEGLSPSDPTRRGWLIPVDGLPTWVMFASGIPAILVYILVFMETHISELIVDKPERGLKKGSGLHMDIVLLSILNSVCGLFGMPWHCAATVRSVTHVSAVTIMSRDHAPGDKPYIADVKEQRLSGFIVSLLVGLSVTMAPLLRLIPMAVLFGVFLYMGIASMSGVQLFDRIRIFFMPVKYHPNELYVKRVPTWKMHIFTGFQVLGLALLWTVAQSRFSLAFPFVLAMMVPLRQKLSILYSPLELSALDGSPAKVEPDNEPDFFEQTSMPA